MHKRKKRTVKETGSKHRKRPTEKPLLDFRNKEMKALPQPKRRKEDGLVKYDPLSAYLNEIRAYPRLTEEEEKELARRYRQDRDMEAAYKLVVSNLYLVVLIARRYEKVAKNLLDLIQEGNIGLMEAVKHFDPEMGTRFPTYAAWWIRAYIVRYIMANMRLVKIGTTQNQRRLFFNLQKEKEKLEKRGFQPTAKLLAEKLDVKEEEVVEMEQRLGGGEVSIDAPLNEEEGNRSALYELIPSDMVTSEALVADKEAMITLSREIENFRSHLSDREQMILDDRILTEDKITLQELGKKLGVSAERVRQIEEKLKGKLRTVLEDAIKA